MKNADDKPQVVDLHRYREAAARRVQARAPKSPASRPTPNAARAAGKEPLLGGRPRAGLFLALVVIFALVLFVGPKFL